MIVRFELTDSGFRCLDAPVLANTASINYLRAKFIIKDKTWDDVTAITAVFKSATYNKVAEVLLDSDRSCFIDPEVYKNGGNIQCQIVGDKYLNGQILSSTHLTQVTSFYIKENVIVPTPIPSKYEVVVAELERAEEAVEAVIELVQTKLENGDFDGEDGEDGVGIASVVYNQDGTLTITLTDGTEITSSYSMKGEKGDTGNGIASVVYGEDGTLVITMTDGTQFESEYSMKGEKGEPGDNGEKGDPGNGIASIAKTSTSGLVDTYTVTFDDETTMTFTVTNGAKGDRGERGYTGVGIDDIEFNSDYSMTISLDDGSTYDSPVLRGEKGETGEKGDPGTTDYNDLENKPDLSVYAETDGSYDTLTAGKAKELKNEAATEDNAPYLFRQSAGGDFAVDTLIGGSIAWNQLVQNGNFADGTNNFSPLYGTLTATDNVGTFTVSDTRDAAAIRQWSVATDRGDRKFLLSMTVKSAKNNTYAFFLGGTTSSKFTVSANTEKTVSTILKTPNTIGDATAYFYMNRESQLSVGDTVSVKKMYVIDLTATFGTEIADYVYSLEQTTEGSGIAWLKSYGFLTKDYYAYNDGSLVSVKTSEHKTTGKNLLDENYFSDTSYFDINADHSVDCLQSDNRAWSAVPTTQKLLAGTYVFSRGTTIGRSTIRTSINDYATDFTTIFDGSSSVTFTLPQDCYLKIKASYSGSYPVTVYPMIRFADVSDATYEPYESHSYSLGNDDLRGIFKLSNGNLYADGDVKTSDGKIARKYSVPLDLGTLNWEYVSGSNSYFKVDAPYVKRPSSNQQVANLICAKYIADTADHVYLHSSDKIIAKTANYDTIWVYDSAYTDAQTFKTAMSGVYLVYELATPTTEQSTPFTSPQIVSPLGTEEYVDERSVPVPVGHRTEYLPNVDGNKLDYLPSLADGQGSFLVEQIGTQMRLKKCDIPDAPTTDGTYTLKVTITDGEAAYSWVADE